MYTITVMYPSDVGQDPWRMGTTALLWKPNKTDEWNTFCSLLISESMQCCCILYIL